MARNNDFLGLDQPAEKQKKPPRKKSAVARGNRKLKPPAGAGDDGSITQRAGREIGRALLTLLIAIVIVTVVVIGVVSYLYGAYLSPVNRNDKNTVEVVVASGASVTSISKLLYTSGIIRNDTVFKYYVDFSDMTSKLKAGTYTLSPSMTIDEIIAELAKGAPEKETLRYTIAEGLTVEGLSDVLISKEVLSGKEEFLSLCTSGSAFSGYSFIADSIAENDESDAQKRYALEGYLFPDTYEVFAGSDSEAIIRKHLDRFAAVWTDSYAARASELEMTVDDVVTLASMIEREAKTQDFAKVSAVFHLRLQKDMTLGSDATLQYIHRSSKHTFSAEERAVDSPYNTYKYKGLPLGPICNPSKNAIEAALWPDEQYLSDGYLYFCLMEPDSGNLIFAKTLDEHNANVAKYKELWQAKDKENGY